MTDEESFLAALRANPTDDTTRLVFADWLDENDQPRKAEYLRLVASLACGATDLSDRQEGAALLALGPQLPDDWRFAAGARFVVILFSYRPGEKIDMCKRVREAIGVGLGEAKDMSERLPCRVRDGLMFDRARDIASKLREVPDAVVAVLPSELEQLPFTVSYEVVASCGVWQETRDRNRTTRAARAALAEFLVRAARWTPAEATAQAESELVVLERGLTAEAAEDRVRELSGRRPPYNLADRWSVTVTARHVVSAVE